MYYDDNNKLNKYLITLALFLMILLFCFIAILFYKNKIYKDFKFRFQDTLMNILGLYQDKSSIDNNNKNNNNIDNTIPENKVDFENNNINVDKTIYENKVEFELKDDNIIESENDNSEYIINDPIATPLTKIKKKKKNKVNSKIQSIEPIYKKKEVFNIDRNDFTYDDASLVCHAYDAQLATHDQIIDAHKKGAHWCNYGWSANQMALYPVQRKIWQKLQQGELNEKTKCQEPNKNGLVGGIFDKKDLKFGVNCYGYRPKPDHDKIIYNGNKKTNIYNDLSNINKQKLTKLKTLKESGQLSVRPHNNKYWSNYSIKPSEYYINNENDETIHINEKTIEDILDSQQNES